MVQVAQFAVSLARTISVALIASCLWLPQLYASGGHIEEFGWDELPADLQLHIRQVRSDCADLNPDVVPNNPLQGITAMDLDGDGRRDFFVENQHICNDHMAGANCSNRGCDISIWQQSETGGFERVLNEHAHRSFLSLNRSTHQFQMLSISIYAGDPRCGAARKSDAMSSESCDLIFRYRRGRLRDEAVN